MTPPCLTPSHFSITRPHSVARPAVFLNLQTQTVPQVIAGEWGMFIRPRYGNDSLWPIPVLHVQFPLALFSTYYILPLLRAVRIINALSPHTLRKHDPDKIRVRWTQSNSTQPSQTKLTRAILLNIFLKRPFHHTSNYPRYQLMTQWGSLNPRMLDTTRGTSGWHTIHVCQATKYSSESQMEQTTSDNSPPNFKPQNMEGWGTPLSR